MAQDRADHAPWPTRALILLVGGALCGLSVDLLTRDHSSGYGWSFTDDVLRLSLAIAVAVGGILFAFTLERVRWTWATAFALAGGLVLGSIYYWNGSPEHQSADDVWRALASLLAVAIAAPLFQTMRDEGARRLPYVTVHAHSWTNVVLWFAAWAFVLISWLLAQLLAELFQLIGIDLLRRLMNKSWFNWMLVGAALGAAIGLLRDRDRVLGLLQRVVTTVLSVLAPVLALGLVLFVFSLPFTGLEPLWDQTRATTPILLSCVIGAIILANAVIGNSSEEETRNYILRISAMALGGVMLPLVAVAGISTGMRIGQHGFTPARLWAVVFISIAGAYALLYLYALVRGRLGWADRVRPANIWLAVAMCAIALFLATPAARFGAISASSQLSRLESGEVAPAEFDWRAMRFDFGASGVAALERLKTSSPNAEVRRLADTALRAQRRWDLADPQWGPRRRQAARNLRIAPAGAAVPAALRDAVISSPQCTQDQPCLLVFDAETGSAALVSPGFCPSEARYVSPVSCEPDVTRYYRDGDTWASTRQRVDDPAAVLERYQRMIRAIQEGRVEVRTVPRRQLFVDGQPVGEPID